MSGQGLQKLLRAFFEVRHISVSPESLVMWVDALSDLSVSEVQAAIRKCNREFNGVPTPAVLRSFAPGVVALSDDQRAAVAWRKVRETIGKYGAYYAIDFDDKIIHAAIRDIGGWVNLCNTPHDEMWSKQNAFLRAYKSVANTGVGDSRPLRGVLESKQEPVMVLVGLPLHSNHKLLGGTPKQPRRVALPDLRANR